ncbi:hypothetical protein WV31_10220 [Magnetospirillum sp. ME-1]|uniref:hypothetical protein n=1 Tax=Magnetospirillum sp. ME-1 TaxID=1639348 RepID=UPI000A17B1E6|nr:hypothetical protein [Magnetospirillum sp. ME-1]ARJ66001.1 hypothetical protein WV31_10220 [Magnetospirillum sp. ME-1]
MRAYVLASIVSAGLLAGCAGSGPGEGTYPSVSMDSMSGSLVPVLPSENAATAEQAARAAVVEAPAVPAALPSRRTAKAQAVPASPSAEEPSPSPVVSAEEKPAVAAEPSAEAAKAPVEEGPPPVFIGKDGEPSLWDLFDVINPLQHIPLLGSVYRELSGDRIGVVAKMGGDTLYWGIPGLIFSAVDIAFGQIAGKEPGRMVFDALFGDDAAPAPSDSPQQEAKLP